MTKTSLPLMIILSSFFLSACTNSQTTPTANNSTQPTQSDSPTLQTTLKDLLTSGASQHCTWQSSDENGQVKGEVWIMGNKFKQSTTVSDDQGEMLINAVGDQQTMYTWNNKMHQGIKMNLESFADTDSQPEASENVNSQVDLNKQLEYHCQATTLTDADFATPSDIQFTDLTQTMQNLQQNMMNFDPNSMDLDELRKSLPGQQ